jgi:1-acyl-sn-glycerol-3-phosphate acyltransferase
MRPVVAAIKITAYLTLTFACMPIQVLILFLYRLYPRFNPYGFARLYHRLCLKIFRIKVIIEGQIDSASNIVYVSNHASHLDIPVIASVLRTAFIAKLDVASWPLFGTLGRLQRTHFISRNPRHAERERNIFDKRLTEPLPLVLFAEGTSTSGEKIKPFKSTLFDVFLNKNIKIQPFTLSILETDKKTAKTIQQKEIYAWGDIPITEHLWLFSKSKGAVIKLKFQQPILANCYNDRKSLSNDCYQSVLEGLDLSSRES